MAIASFATAESHGQLHPGRTLPAGILILTLAAGAAIGLGLFLALGENLNTYTRVVAAVELAMTVMASAAGVQLLRGRAWAQRLLLGLLLAMAVLLLVGLSADLLGQAPSWWQRPIPQVRPPADSAAVPVTVGWGVIPPTGSMAAGLAAAVAGAAAMWWVSAKGSRLRYGSTVAVAIGAAVAVVVLVNLIAHADPWRTSVETLGRYSLSERSRRILRKVDAPIRLTCVYASPEKRDRSDEYRRDVVELLQEMHEAGANVTVEVVDSESEKADFFERIKARLNADTESHAALFQRFAAEAPRLAESLRAKHDRWTALADRSYLDYWALPAQVADGLNTIAQEWAEARRQAQAELGGIPDYAKLSQDVSSLLDATDQFFAQSQEIADTLARIPPAVAHNSEAAMQSVDQCLASLATLQATLAPPPDGAPPSDPAEALQAFAAAAKLAEQHCLAAADALANVAGKDLAPFITQSRPWLVRLSDEPVALLAGVPVLGQNTVDGAFRSGKDIVGQLRGLADNRLRAANREYQQRAVAQELPEPLKKLIALLQGVRPGAAAAMQALANVDEPTRRLLAEGPPFQQEHKAVQDLREGLAALPSIQQASLPEDIAQPNIVLIEMEGKTPQVVSFDEVWPLKPILDTTLTGEDEAPPRTFNGDSAIASRILAIAEEPFATVLLTYATVAPELARMMPRQILFTPDRVSELRARLESANLDVQEWDLATPFPQGDPNAPGADRPTVLLVLPPPPPIPPMPWDQGPPTGLTPEHVEKIRARINAGTPAIFLAQWMIPVDLSNPPPYPLNPYLEADWGIQARTDYLVIPALRSETEPGRFNLAVTRLSHLPLNAYTDHPIGAPLRGQRTLWTMISPLKDNVRSIPGVKVTPVLTVPDDGDPTWATPDVGRILQAYYAGERSYVAPDYERQDLPAPFPVVLAASRDADPAQDRRPARIVVVGVGAGVIDPFLTDRVPSGPQLTQTLDPPAANADLIINSVYWLSGREDYIAAGPVHIQPVANLPRSAMRSLWIVYVLGLPLGVLATGGLVLLLRRR